MRSTTTYILSIFTFCIVILLSLLISGCSVDRSPEPAPDTLVEISYNLKQCETTPWSDWLSNSSIRFIRAPTEEEVLTMFYTQEYNITVSKIRVITPEAACEACGVCSRGNIVASVKLKDIQVMLDTGWKRMQYL